LTELQFYKFWWIISDQLSDIARGWYIAQGRGWIETYQAVKAWEQEDIIKKNKREYLIYCIEHGVKPVWQ
jgi:hypothetical protein